MKKLIALAAVLSLGSLFAGDTVTNFYGLLKVNSGDARTIVAIPWIDASTTNGEITVADVVRTAELAPDDTIHYYNGTDFESWKLNSETQWVAAVQVASGGYEEASEGTDADKRALKRGNALILMRTNSAHRANCLYLWGQVASTTATTEITPNAYNLIAPPVVNEVGTVNLNSGASWQSVNANDRIYIQTSTNNVECKFFAGEGWKRYDIVSREILGGDEVVEYGWMDAGSILLGTGVWYKAAEGSGVSVTWNDVPIVTAPANN